MCPNEGMNILQPYTFLGMQVEVGWDIYIYIYIYIYIERERERERVHVENLNFIKRYGNLYILINSINLAICKFLILSFDMYFMYCNPSSCSLYLFFFFLYK